MAGVRRERHGAVRRGVGAGSRGSAFGAVEQADGDRVHRVQRGRVGQRGAAAGDGVPLVGVLVLHLQATT